MSDWIVENFIGNETASVTKQRLTEIAEWWGFDPSTYTTWGDLRNDLNTVSPVAILNRELASSFLQKINILNAPSELIFNSLFSTGEPGVWLDPSDPATLFRDTAGITQAGIGDPVALVLDKSQGLVLGPEMVTNGDFSEGDAGWTVETGWTISEGVATKVSGTQASISQNIGAKENTLYEIQWDATVVSGALILRLGAAGVNIFITASSGSYRRKYYAAGSSGVFELRGDGAFEGTIDNISVRELPGNHSSQPTLASRPILGRTPAMGRRNLVSHDSDLLESASGNRIIRNTVDQVVGPFSKVTEMESNVSGSSFVTFTSTPIISSADADHCASFYVPSIGLNTTIGFTDSQGDDVIAPRFDATTGEFTNNSSPGLIAARAAPVSGGWLIEIVYRKQAGEYRPSIWVNGYASSDVGRKVRFAGVQFERGSVRTPYQRVGSDYDVTEAGVPTNHYLSFDGVDDFMVTTTITPGTDKVQVFAGVRKLSDAETAMVVELGASVLANNGGMNLLAPSVSGANSYRFGTKGTTESSVGTGVFAAAPDTSVITGIGDISGAVARLRRNGELVEERLTTQGTGNYLAAALRIGARSGSSFFFNGHIYSLIARFGPNLPIQTIEYTERHVAKHTGVDL